MALTKLRPHQKVDIPREHHLTRLWSAVLRQLLPPTLAAQ